MNILNINYNLYKSFLATYEQKNMTLAAKHLMITLSAVSRNIKEIEERLDMKLFNAHARGVTPTKDADELYELINSAFNTIKNAEIAVKNLTKETTGTLSFSCPSHFASTFLLDYFCNFNLKFPKIKIEEHFRHKDEALQMLLKRKFDCVITVLPIPENPCFETTRLKEMQYVFFATKTFLKQHGLGTTVKKTQLKNLPVIVPSKDFHSFKNLANKLKIDFNNATESANSAFILGMVLKDKGIGYCLQEYLDFNKNNEIVRLKIDETLPKSVLTVVSNNDDTSKITKEFIKGLQEFCSNI